MRFKVAMRNYLLLEGIFLTSKLTKNIGYNGLAQVRSDIVQIKALYKKALSFFQYAGKSGVAACIGVKEK